jgi:O-acetyl-ADP-ribose deacetylase (regulator of RNase III)
VITGAGELPARYVIHTVGPVYAGHTPDEAAGLLASCYRSSLDLAAEHGCATVAFPNISTGVYGYPKPEAAATAVGVVAEWVAKHPGVVEAITFVCFDRENHDLYTELRGTT